jgi:hypothetical protein
LSTTWKEIWELSWWPNGTRTWTSMLVYFKQYDGQSKGQISVFIVIAFIRKTLNCISVKGRGNHALAPPVSWPPPTEDTILVASPESQRSLWSWFLQAKCYRQSIFIHYTYNSYYVCSFPHHNIHTHIKYIFICFYRFRDFDHYSSFLWCDNLGDIYLIMNLVFHACMEDVEFDLYFV